MYKKYLANQEKYTTFAQQTICLKLYSNEE